MSHSPPESPFLTDTAAVLSSGDERGTSGEPASPPKFTRTSKPTISKITKRTTIFHRLRFKYYPNVRITSGRDVSVTSFIPDGGSDAIVFHSHEDAAKYENAVRAQYEEGGGQGGGGSRSRSRSPQSRAQSPSGREGKGSDAAGEDDTDAVNAAVAALSGALQGAAGASGARPSAVGLAPGSSTFARFRGRQSSNPLLRPDIRELLPKGNGSHQARHSRRRGGRFCSSQTRVIRTIARSFPLREAEAAGTGAAPAMAGASATAARARQRSVILTKSEHLKCTLRSTPSPWEAASHRFSNPPLPPLIRRTHQQPMAGHEEPAP